jgi:hypothetical protein
MVIIQGVLMVPLCCVSTVACLLGSSELVLGVFVGAALSAGLLTCAYAGSYQLEVQRIVGVGIGGGRAPGGFLGMKIAFFCLVVVFV